MRAVLIVLLLLLVPWQAAPHLLKVQVSPGRNVQSDVMGRATQDVVVRVNAEARDGDGVAVVLEGPRSEVSRRPWRGRTEEFRYHKLPAGDYAIDAVLVDSEDYVLDRRAMGVVTVAGADRE